MCVQIFIIAKTKEKEKKKEKQMLDFVVTVSVVHWGENVYNCTP